MNELQFCYWLQGYFELTDSGQPLSAQQVQIIKDHLELVFKKVTPDRVLNYSIDYSPVKMSTPIPGDGYGVDIDNSSMFKYPNGYIERSC